MKKLLSLLMAIASLSVSDVSAETKAIDPQRYIINAYGTDGLIITGSGLVTFPHNLIRHHFQRQVDNITFIIPSTGVYEIITNFVQLNIPSGSFNIGIILLIDGQQNKATGFQISQDQFIGGTNSPPISFSRILKLTKGQTVAVFVQASDNSSSFMFVEASNPFVGFSNRSISIKRIH